MEYRHRVSEPFSIEFNGCHAVHGAVEPQLMFAAQARSPFDFPLTVLSMEGVVNLSHPREGMRFLGPLRRMSMMEPPHPMGFVGRGSAQEHFILSLNWKTLEEIERLRDGKELSLKANMQFLCARLEDKNPNPKIEALFWVQAEAVRGQVAHMVFPQREWLEALKVWGYADRRILEVEIPSLESLRSDFATALKHIETAERKLWEGHYDDVMTAARKCHGALSKAIDSHLDSIKKLDGNEIRHRKLEGFNKAVKGLLDVGPHADRPAERAEALMVLSVLKEMLAFFGARGAFSAVRS